MREALDDIKVEAHAARFGSDDAKPEVGHQA